MDDCACGADDTKQFYKPLVRFIRFLMAVDSAG
jgi:hypothetical protein